MSNTVSTYPDTMLEHVRLVRGEQEYSDFLKYSCTPDEQKAGLESNVEHHYNTVKRILDKMVSYGDNHWWTLLSSDEIKSHSVEAKKLRKMIRVYFQVFDCGLETQLIAAGQLANDINDILAPTGLVITTWVLRYPQLFERYKKELEHIIDTNKTFQAYLKQIDSC